MDNNLGFITLNNDSLEINLHNGMPDNFFKEIFGQIGGIVLEKNADGLVQRFQVTHWGAP